MKEPGLFVFTANEASTKRFIEKEEEDRQWFKDHSDRVLYLRKALAWERNIPFRGNAVIIAKITEQGKTIHFVVKLPDKPVNKTLSEWIDAHNHEIFCAVTLSEMPVDVPGVANAFALVHGLRNLQKERDTQANNFIDHGPFRIDQSKAH